MKPSNTLLICIGALTLTLGVACDDSQSYNNSPHTIPDTRAPDTSSDTHPSDTTTNPGAAVTYHRDIAPLLAMHCNECHVPNSTAPFAFGSFAEVQPLALFIAAAVEAGTMPPWPPLEGCQEFKHERRLSSEEIALMRAWADDGAPEGDPADAVVVVLPERIDLGQPDYVFDTGVEYKPQPPEANSIDDYRCFVVDPGLEADVFVNGYETLPGNPALVHHAIIYEAPQSQAAKLADLEALDDRPGYTCFGGPRVSDVRMLSGWAPGSAPLKFPANHGIRLRKGSKLVLQVHYNTLNDKQGTDRTKINLHYTKAASPSELAIIPLAQGNLFVAAGDKEGFATVNGPALPLNVSLYGISAHMHMLGSSIDIKASANDREMCLLDIPRWDFNWQGFYLYKEPITVPRNWITTLNCHYDNSPQNQSPGREPHDLRWGDGTFDEMCLAYFIILVPPGISL
ncbi:MAG: hypothetical protein H0U74_06260 [Bradymonadaceae bacterium]|nr:hypothetical protein [Lujinxingiaceae bacterium]